MSPALVAKQMVDPHFANVTKEFHHYRLALLSCTSNIITAFLFAFTQAWKPGSQHAGEKRGVAGLLLGRTERAARAAELQLCAQAR